MSQRILVGDVRSRLRELADQSVQCVVTSPPYYNLRDYQTAQWEGGDLECDHRPARLKADRNEDRQTFGDNWATHGTQLKAFGKRKECDKCGATKTDNQIGLEPTVDCGNRQRLRLRSDLTEAQREYVVRRLLGVVPAWSCCDKAGTASCHCSRRSGGQDAQPTT